MASKNGCEHYERRCALKTPCCGKVYNCRLCHDDKEEHSLDRKSVEVLKCLQCEKEQEVSSMCVQCGIHFGFYTCLKCRLFDDKDKGQFHCDECGICRVGGQENFYHCSICDICLPHQSKDSHKCIDKGARNNCPICMEDIHASRISAQMSPCGHLLHSTCLSELLKSGNYSCPLCNRSVVDMTSMWKHLDGEIENTPMPDEYRNVTVEIKCRDCQKDSKVKFHVLGHKCDHCKSYNTAREKIEGLPDIPVPPETGQDAEEDDDDDEWTTEEEEEVLSEESQEEVLPVESQEEVLPEVGQEEVLPEGRQEESQEVVPEGSQENRQEEILSEDRQEARR